ncbi:hypothetical protein RF186_05885, partial [Escherichia coli]|nr:hypothetical protein [Escherichia coli]
PLPAASRHLLHSVQASLTEFCIPPRHAEIPVLTQLLSRIGRAVDTLWQDSRQILGFIGLIIATLGRRAL